MAFMEETGNPASSGSGRGVGNAQPPAIAGGPVGDSSDHIREIPSTTSGGGAEATQGARAATQTFKGDQRSHILPFLGMHAHHGQSYGPTDRSYDYTRKYPFDPDGKQLNPDARFWKVYLDESESYDADMVTGFRNTIDGTLIFAALFSSIVTGFVVESSKKLEPDYGQINASLLVENNLLLRAGGNMSKIEAVPKSSLGSDSHTHSPPDVVVNWMFFASLSLALVTALLSILAKQWLQEFTTLIPGDAKERCLIRQFRYMGVRKWKFREIVNVLPILLHVSLVAFLVGLGVSVRDFHAAIQFVADFTACIPLGLYLLTAALPAIFLDCPYRLPILYTPASFAVYLFKRILFKLLQRSSHVHFSSSSFVSQEREHVLAIKARFEAFCIAWLFKESTNISVQQVSLDAAAGFLESYRLQDEDKFATEILSLPGLCSFAVRLANSLPHPLEDTLSPVRFLVAWHHRCVMTPPVAWHVALYSPKLLDMFLESHFPIDIKYSYGDLKAYPLQHAIRLKRWEAAELLIPRSPASHFTGFGDLLRTPLMEVCTSNHISEMERLTIINLLLTYGADVQDLDRNGWNALHSASRRGTSSKILDVLLRSVGDVMRSAVVNQQGSGGVTPLLLACRHCSPSAIPLLLSAGANANVQDERGQTPLHFACMNMDDSRVLEQLADASMRVLNSVVKDVRLSIVIAHPGATPLDMLVYRRSTSDQDMFKSVYKMLRAKGAVCNLKSALQAELDSEFNLEA